MNTPLASVLFVCTGNAGRSQMAEALVRQLAADRISVSSAGVDPWDDLHPVARRLLVARGLDLSTHYPKHVRTLADQSFDLVITIGDRARDELPPMPRAGDIRHWEIPDPADADGTPRQEQVFALTLKAIERGVCGLLDSDPHDA